ETLAAGLERADGGGADTHHVPLAQLANLVVEPDPPRSSDDDIGLFLLAVAVRHRRAHTGPVAEGADSPVLGTGVRAGHASFETRLVLACGILDLLEVHDRKARHRAPPRVTTTNDRKAERRRPRTGNGVGPVTRADTPSDPGRSRTPPCPLPRSRA